MNDKWSSDRSYVADNGLVCPYCGSKGETYLYPESMVYTEFRIEAEVTCNVCERERIEIYELAGWAEKEDAN